MYPTHPKRFAKSRSKLRTPKWDNKLSVPSRKNTSWIWIAANLSVLNKGSIGRDCVDLVNKPMMTQMLSTLLHVWGKPITESIMMCSNFHSIIAYISNSPRPQMLGLHLLRAQKTRHVIYYISPNNTHQIVLPQVTIHVLSAREGGICRTMGFTMYQQ